MPLRADMRSVLVIGYGSIGARHARLLSSLDNRVVLVTRRPNSELNSCYPTIELALEHEQFSAAIIANETSGHLTSLKQLRANGFLGPVLVEKPLAAHRPDASELVALCPEQTWIGYNLRFHPALQRLKERMAAHTAISVSIYAGQDLQTWRTGRDPGDSYSAKLDQGGGVLRDLSHELDYMTWIFGFTKQLTASGGRVGAISVDADDCWAILASTEKCPIVSLQIDYYHKPGARNITVNTEGETIEVDLLNNSYRDSSGTIFYNIDRDHTYIEQLKAFLKMSDADLMCDFKSGMETMRIIEAVERASSNKIWINL